MTPPARTPAGTGLIRALLLAALVGCGACGRGNPEPPVPHPIIEDPGPSRPSVPNHVVASALNCASIELKWAIPAEAGGAGVKGYKVFRDGGYLSETTARDFTDTGLAPETRYAYRVSAVDNNGNESAQSSPAEVSTPACGDLTRTWWAKAFGTISESCLLNYYDEGQAVAADGEGNLYLVGRAAGAIDFGSGPVGATTSDNRAFAIIVASFRPDGTPRWAKAFGAGTSELQAARIAVDNAGDIYLTGCFWGQADFGGGPVASDGSNDPLFRRTDILFVKLAGADGSHRFSRRYGGSGYDCGYSVAVAAASEPGVVLAGQFSGHEINLAGFTLKVSEYYSDPPRASLSAPFLAKFDLEGRALWAKAFGGTTVDAAAGSQAVDLQGNIATTGWFRDTINLGGQCGELSSTATNWDGYIGLLNPRGECRWARSFAGFATDVSFGPGDRPVFTGDFDRDIHLGGETLRPDSDTLPPKRDLFLARYEASGRHLWSKRIGAREVSEALARVSVDPSDNIVLLNSQAGQRRIVLAKYRGRDGEPVWSTQYGAPSVTAWGLATDPFGYISITGVFFMRFDFGTGALESRCDGGDIFLLRRPP